VYTILSERGKMRVCGGVYWGEVNIGDKITGPR
jgi:hypothetical protein